MDRVLFGRLGALRSIPQQIIVLTAAASYASQALAVLQGWPLWAVVLATLLPWVPLLTFEMVWTYRHYHWLAVLYVLTITQLGHFGEHAVQMVQIHLLGLRGPDARGIFGALDTEWVHFTWNTWILVATLLLLRQFPRNPWLWVVLVLGGWHELEHAYIMTHYLSTGAQGNPGLLARGGAVLGGTPLVRPDLHFLYNLLETLPIVFAFIWQLRHSYDEWLKRALPHVSEQVLVRTTGLSQALRYEPGSVVIRQGDAADRFYIITSGQAAITRRDASGAEAQLATLGPGQFFGEIGLLHRSPRTASVTAQTPLEVLAMDYDTFRGVVDSSEATSQDLEARARQRLAASGATP